MKFIIDIDNGGTFTDGFFTGDARIEWVKVDTTPHDLSVCFLKCIEDGAKKFGVTVSQLLHETEVLRFSTTHATNTLRVQPLISSFHLRWLLVLMNRLVRLI